MKFLNLLPEAIESAHGFHRTSPVWVQSKRTVAVRFASRFVGEKLEPLFDQLSDWSCCTASLRWGLLGCLRLLARDDSGGATEDPLG
jgi:hypothetical protein